MHASYVGRFAPSPTGPLHRGSLVAALASYLDARVHGGCWLIRMEDVDEARTVPGAAESILHCLQTMGMRWDGDIVWQSQRKPLYDAAFARLSPSIFPCACTRREIADSRTALGSDGAAVYPGTCRSGLAPGKAARAFRLRMPDDQDNEITFDDRWMGRVKQNLSQAVGDFVLKRADGYWAYQLAVVVDDADQKVTHVVRGADLLDSTPRQIFLQRLLGYRMPQYLHVPVVTNAKGEKLSKQTGALPLDLGHPIDELVTAARFLGLEVGSVRAAGDFWERAVPAWEQLLSDSRHATRIGG